MNWILKHIKGDKWIWMIIFALSMCSMLAVYSSTGTLAYRYQSGNISYYLIKHMTMILVGLGLMYIAHLINYRYYSRGAQLLLYISIPLLLFTLFFGSEINQASRWVKLPGTSLTFQTSDIAKLALVMFLARELSKRQEKIKNFKEAFLPIVASVIVICGLIAPANLSTALLVFGTSVLLLLIGRISAKQIGIVCLAGGILITTVVFFGPRRETYISRVNAFLHPEKADPDKKFQTDQAKIAIATGGFFGKGPGNSTQRNFLPSPFADFIYAIIIEEYGLFGAGFIIMLYLVLLFRCIRIVTLSPKAFGALLAAGLSFSLTIQAFANMAVAVNLFPVTGVALPLVSMGGTSILFNSIAFGIILSVSKDIEEIKKGGELAAA